MQRIKAGQAGLLFLLQRLRLAEQRLGAAKLARAVKSFGLLHARARIAYEDIMRKFAHKKLQYGIQLTAN